jgi:hypothetical protein
MYNAYSAVVFVQMLIMATLALWQPTYERKLIAALFIVPVLLHDTLFTAIYHADNPLALWLNGMPFLYLVAGAGISLWTVTKLAKLYNPSYLASRLQYVCALSILFELAGWLMYRFAVSDDLTRYNILYIVLYGYAIIALRQGEPKDAGNHYRNNTADDRFFVNHNHVRTSRFTHHNY